MKILHAITHVDADGDIGKVPIVEIAGSKRVLIENHLGVIAYSIFEIQIKVSYGTLFVTGDHLTFKEISKDQLVITGEIASVHLERR